MPQTTSLLAGQIWAPYTPGYPAQPLVHPSPQTQAIPTAAELPPGQATSRSRPSTSRASTSRASAGRAKKALICPSCRTKCRDSWTLKDHMLNHSELRPHKCNVCEKSFKRPRDLKGHENKHTTSSTSQLDASSERGRVKFHIQTPRSYPRCIPSRSEGEVESEFGNGINTMTLDDETHKPLLFDPFLFDSRYQQSNALPQRTMDELDNVPQGGDVGPEVRKILERFDHDFTAYGCSPVNGSINRQPGAQHDTGVRAFSTGLNPRYGAGDRLPPAIPAPSSSEGTGSLEEIEVPPLDNGTDSESPPSSSLNTSESQPSQLLSQRNENTAQQPQVDDQSSSTDRRSPLLRGNSPEWDKWVHKEYLSSSEPE